MELYDVIKHRHVTEKSRMLENLQESNSNACTRKCNKPMYVFIVDKRANKPQIAAAIEGIYAQKNIKVVSVNTINKKPKKRRVRGRLGKTDSLKKAIVTLEPGDVIDEV